MRRVLAGIMGAVVLLGATGALAESPLSKPAKLRHAAVGRPASAPDTPSTRQMWDNLVKGSPEQQAAERKDNEMAGIKPLDHRKDDFFSDWRGLR